MVNVKDEKLRQRVREESEELRQLKSALVRGYVNKEREKQILEKIERQQEAIVEEIQVQFVIFDRIFISTEFQTALERHLSKKIDEASNFEPSIYIAHILNSAVAPPEHSNAKITLYFLSRSF